MYFEVFVVVEKKERKLLFGFSRLRCFVVFMFILVVSFREFCCLLWTRGSWSCGGIGFLCVYGILYSLRCNFYKLEDGEFRGFLESLVFYSGFEFFFLCMFNIFFVICWCVLSWYLSWLYVDCFDNVCLFCIVEFL